MSEQEKPGKDENRRPPSGLVSSPRAYFGRASRAATGALRAGIANAAESGPAAGPKGPLVYSAGDPALRLFAGFELPLSPTTPLTGAIATLSGIRDGEHEKLFVDLGTTLVRATRQRDDTAGTLTLVLSRTQSAETYSGLIASLRYVNDAVAPAPGVRHLALQILDAGGAARDVADAQFGVGEAPLEETPAGHVDAQTPAAPAAAREAPEASERAADPRLAIGENVAFNTEGEYTVFWWPNRLPPVPARARRAARQPQPSPEAAAGSFFSDGGKLYRLFETPEERRAPPTSVPLTPAPLAEAPAVPAAAPPVPIASAPAPLAASAVLAAQTPAAANDSAPGQQRAANDSVWVPGRGVPPPGFARPSMLRLEDIFGSDMQDAVARRLIDMRIAAAGG